MPVQFRGVIAPTAPRPADDPPEFGNSKNTAVRPPRLLHPLGFCLYGFTLLTSAQLAPASSLPGLDQPEPVGAYFNGVFPNTPPGDPSGWAVENAFPNLTFTDPLMLAEIPGSSNLLLVGKNGQIWRFPNNPAATAGQKVLVADLTARVETSEDQGLYSLAFHPQFAQSGAPGENKVYVCYNRRAVTGVDDNDRTYWTVSQFNWIPASGTIDTASENILISQYDPHRFHNGGAMFFGDDTFLYITAGDGGLGGDALDNAQRLDLGFFGGVLRIDVNNDPTKSHPIRRQPTEDENWWLDHPDTVQPKPAAWPASHAQGYGIPNDNPWLDANGNILEEFYAIGLRSPHSAHFDPVTDEIWVGDVGEANREELTRITKGANAQWAFLEGTRPTSKSVPNPLIGTAVPPLLEYTHAEGASIIGGPRYRGAKWAEFLAGKVIYGDHIRGRIWSTTVPASGAPVIQEMYSSFDTGYKKGLCGFFTDSAGEIYMMNLSGTNTPGNGKIMKLALPALSAEPPQFLSQTGVFTNLATLATASGVIPYAVPNPLWSDAAAKKRWMILPNDGSFNSAAEDVVFSAEGSWAFPAGTVFVKHFETNTDANNPAAVKRLETRFLVCTAGGGKYGFTYKWNAAGTDAELLEQGAEENYTYTNSVGGNEQRTWSYPSRGDCLICHNDVSGQALGVRTANFNSDFHYASTDRTANQLNTLNAMGAFSVTLTAAQIESYIEARPLTDETAPLEHRVRSYLDTNCSHCHQPGGSGDGFDARLGTPLDLQNLINGIPQRFESLGPDGRYISPGSTSLSAVFVRASAVGNGDAMPPLAKNLAHTAGIAALQSYISGLNPTEFNTLTPPKARYVRLKSLAGNRSFAAVREFQILDGEGVPIPVNQLSIHDFDSETSANPAIKVIDGSTGSSNLWQTSNTAPVPPHPHHVTIDLGSLREFGGYKYWPRLSSGGDGNISQYQILYSEDATTWSIFDSGTWPTNITTPITFAPAYNKRSARCQMAGPVVPVEGSFQATVVFDMDMLDFTSSDISVQNGTVTELKGSGYYYVATIAPTPGATQVNVSIAPNVATPDPMGSLAPPQGSLAPLPLAVTILPDQQPPTTPANFDAVPGLFSVALSWDASSDNVGVTEYQVWRDGALIATVPGLGYTDNTVTAETEYDYSVVALDGLANASAPALLTVTTLGDTMPPSTPANLDGVAGLFSIQLSWDPSSDNLGVTDYQVWRNSVLIATVASPGYTDNGLLIDTEYHYSVIALDAANNSSAPALLTKRTLADTQAPTTPGSLGGTPGLVSVQLNWTASSDNVGVTGYEVRRDSVPIATVSSPGYTDNDLLPDTNYTYQVRALDARANASDPAEVSVTTLADTQNPSVPASLVATPGLLSVQLTWQASSDNLGVTGYLVRRNGEDVATVPGPGFTDNDLVTETLYSYEVIAIDAAGNHSAAATVSTTTLADTQAPTTPALFDGEPGLQSIELVWSASSDNIGVTGYRIYRGPDLITTVASLTFTDTGLEPDTSYDYELVAIDAKGNASPAATLSLATTADEQPPTAPTGLDGTPDFTSVALTWDASGDNLEVTGYQIIRDDLLIAVTPALAFTDTGLSRGKPYVYKVCAIDEAGNVSPPAILPISTLGFEDWLDQNGLAGQTAADSDHGGLDNLDEYYLGMDPNSSADDLEFSLTCEPAGPNVHVTYPVLKPVGSYHLHVSSSLADITDLSKRVDTLTIPEIEAMTPAERSTHTLDVPVTGSRAFYMLIFSPPLE
jgi:uncharacterized repeat protein (TIGR03806 family)